MKNDQIDQSKGDIVIVDDTLQNLQVFINLLIKTGYKVQGARDGPTALAMIEKAMIGRALKMANNVQAHAAEMLGIGKSGLNQKLKKYGMDAGSKPRA